MTWVSHSIRSTPTRYDAFSPWFLLLVGYAGACSGACAVVLGLGLCLCLSFALQWPPNTTACSEPWSSRVPTATNNFSLVPPTSTHPQLAKPCFSNPPFRHNTTNTIGTGTIPTAILSCILTFRQIHSPSFALSTFPHLSLSPASGLLVNIYCSAMR